LFNQIDKDHSGWIEISELSFQVKRLLPGASAGQIKALMKLADTHSNGKIDQNEFFEFLGHSPSSFKESKAVHTNQAVTETAASSSASPSLPSPSTFKPLGQ
jgi:hypothetical protein